MAIKIRDGGNGSFKSSACVWFDLLPALRAGRAVITNIEGLLPLDEMEKVLGEKFPSGAKLIRVYSCSDFGVKLWQGWYNWIPPDCMIIIDEAQDIFSKVSGFNAEKSLYQGLEPFLQYLPDWWPAFFAERLDSYKKNYKETSSDSDDVGERMFDDLGNPVWPAHFMSACKRHRKFTWDMIWLTPDISDIPADVRGCAELAINHRNKSIAFFAPRRCRMWERHPKTTGVTPPKGDTVYSKKIPVKVFLLYRSTLTGKFTKSGLGKLPPAIRFAVLSLILCVGVVIYAAFFLSSPSAPDLPPDSGQPVSKSVTANVPAAVPISWPFSVSARDLFFDIRNPKILSQADFFRVHLGINESPVLKGFTRAGTRFSVAFESDSFVIGSDELESFGVVAVPISKDLCAVALRSGDDVAYARCDISRPKKPVSDTPERPVDVAKLL
ncbi:MAG: zonular occludens toxin domain-containing protein [Plesiomonas sp.]|uniref:zonular occludens toxin domain-containing protein n=1 Tax=Plesiomonas sp. TaxID=2486279 RepID=UPI003F372EE7